MASERVDIDFNFRPHPLTGDLPLKRGSNAIKQSLKNIVLTSFYERGFNIAFGTNINSSLFELYSPLEIMTMKNFIREAINNFEHDVEIVDIIESISNINDNAVGITIEYTELNNPNTQTVEINLIKLR